MKKSRKLKTWLSVAVLVLGGVAAAWVYAQVTVTEEEPRKTLPEDPLQFLSTAPNAPLGKLLYLAAVRIEGQPARQRFLVLRGVGKAMEQANLDATYRATIPIQMAEVAFDPQFSPDGQAILFKVGWPYDTGGTYRPYIWDLKSKQLRGGLPGNLKYRRILWSPDGRYFAYCRGGSAEGSLGYNVAPLELFLYDLQTKTKRSIAKNPAAQSFAWTPQGTLLYCVLDEKAWKARLTSNAPTTNGVQPALRPDIYEVPAAGGKPELVLQDGYRPVPSPDGQWLACFTSTDPNKNIVPTGEFFLDFPVQSYLCLYNRAENKRIIVQPTKGIFPHLLWTPDSKRLVVLEATYQGTQGTGHVSVIDVPSLKMQEIAVLQTKDPKPIPRGDPQQLFQSLGVSKNGAFLLVKVLEITGHKDNFSTALLSLQAIDLRSRKISTLASFKSKQGSMLGLDWFDLSTPQQESVKTQNAEAAKSTTP